jgi:hypothetical protein
MQRHRGLVFASAALRPVMGIVSADFHLSPRLGDLTLGLFSAACVHDRDRDSRPTLFEWLPRVSTGLVA